MIRPRLAGGLILGVAIGMAVGVGGNCHASVYVVYKQFGGGDIFKGFEAPGYQIQETLTLKGVRQLPNPFRV